jgi:hypothetical protein
MRKRSFAIMRCVGSVAVFGALLVASASAAAQTPGRFRGVVTAHTPAGRALRAQLHGAGAANNILGLATNMTYNGGPVMHTDANYSIYWEPSGYSTPASYKSTIDGYFGNVAGANGATTNDYSVATQYPDGSGAFTYGASFGGRIVDTNPYPASGCSSGSGPCITDAQLQAELNNVISSHGLPRGTGSLYFVYFPSGVTTCFDSTGSQCSGNVYCAYHSSLGSGSSATLYANMPYDGVSGCESGQYPNGDVAADSELNVTSHENIEAITDPLGNAWYDATGQEIGDKCNFNFGSPTGGAAGSEYNESISSGHYWLQQEWSNAASGCVQRS